MIAPIPESSHRLRHWQQRAIQTYLATTPQDFLLVATPGAGKTTFALHIANHLFNTGMINQLTVVVPTEHLKLQWAHAATSYGLALDPRFSNSSPYTSREYHGVVLTYAQVARYPFTYRLRTQQNRCLIIFDEIHHGGEAKTWGESLREAFSEATYRLALTGTPFRSDDNPIPFIHYAPNSNGALQSVPNYSYTYPDALADGVVRPVIFMAYSGQARWRDSAGEEYAARIGEPLSAEQTTRAWRTILDPKGQWIPAVITAADTRLRQLRAGGIPDAGGMIIATDQKTARAYAKLLQLHTGHEPVVVLSDDPAASTKIAQFSSSTQPWLIAVRMVSEGVDIPRLLVGVYATNSSTPLFFAQAIGRFVRSRRPGETASIFLPSLPNLLQLASELETQRNHVLGQPHRIDLDDPLLENTQISDHLSEIENSFESLGADAELDQVIFDGSSFGTATPAGSDEEADYLGIPGLLDPQQTRELLAHRQAKQFDRRSQTPHSSVSHPSSNSIISDSSPTLSKYEQLTALRQELNQLVSAAHYRLGKPHSWIHNELRRICGGPAVAAATTHQLRARIIAVQKM